jgi:hypothetical protein
MKMAQPSGRVPHVRPSVRGTKTMGRSPFERVSLDARDTVPEIAARTEVKAFEGIVFGPCTLKRTPGFPVTRLRDTTVCAAFFTESRMKVANATSLDRKSGTWGTRPEPQRR